MPRSKVALLTALAAGVIALVTGVVVPQRVVAQAKSTKPKVLYVPLSDLPPKSAETILEVLRSKADMLSTSSYMRSAAKRGMRYGSVVTLKRLGRRGAPDIIVVAGLTSERQRTVTVTYRSGETINKIRETEFTVGDDGDVPAKAKVTIMEQLDAAVSPNATKQAVRLEEVTITQPAAKDAAAPSGAAAAAGVTGSASTGVPTSAEPSAEATETAKPTESEAAEEEATEEKATKSEKPKEAEAEGPLLLTVGGGFGVGQRLIKLPTAGGTVSLSTAPYAAAHADFNLGFRLKSPKHRIGFTARYDTSVILKVTEQFPDGTSRGVNARSQDVSFHLFHDWKWWNYRRSPWLHTAIGADLRMFTPDQMVSVPSNMLLAGYVQAGLFFRVGSGPLVFGVVPEVGAVAYVSSKLKDAGVDSLGYQVGGEIHTRYEIRKHFHIGFFYRESHAIIGTDQKDNFRDTLRYVTLTAIYAL